MRILMAAGVLLALAGCGKEASSPEAAEAVPAAASAKQADEPQAAVTIGGRLRAHDGAPLRQAEFVVTREGFQQPVAKGALGADGSFRVEVEPGVYLLEVAAVDHTPIAQPLLVERAIEVEGDLGTPAREEPGETLSLQSVWLDARGEALALGPTAAPRAADGTYHVALTDKPEQAAQLRYRISAGERTYTGPLADSYEHVGGDLWSVVSLAGREALVLDLSALPPAGKPSQLTWRGVPPELLALQAFRQKWEPRVLQVYARILEGGSLTEPGEQEKAELATLAAEALAEADAAGSDDARLQLRLAHLDLFAREGDDAAARAHAEWVIERVDPQDRRLALFGGGMHNVLFPRVAAAADEAFSARIEQWYARAQANPEATTALAAVSFLLHRADDRGDEARLKELYAVAQEPRFAGTGLADHLKQAFNPDRPLQRGKRLPDFEFPGLSPDDPPIKSADRAGRLYLLEFWATWCGPCVVDMPETHAAYAKVNGAQPGEGDLRRLAPVEQPKVEFVFVSLDASPAEVKAFRAEQWSMPWTHAFAGFDRDSELRARYGFSDLPQTVLVDGTGTIIELGQALRGSRLLPTLERVLAEQ